MEHPDRSEVMSFTEVSEYIGVTINTVFTWASKGKLQPHGCGLPKRWFYREDVVGFKAERERREEGP